MAAKTALMGSHDELSEAASVLAITNALDSTLAGNSASNKGYGVQQVRDASGKLIEVVVFFDEKVPQSKKAAAMEKIERNAGVATINQTSRDLFENFDDEALGSVPYPFVNYRDSWDVSDDKSASSPNSFRLTLTSPASGTNRFFQIENAYLVGQGEELSRFRLQFKVCMADMGIDSASPLAGQLYWNPFWYGPAGSGSGSRIDVEYNWTSTVGGIADTGVPTASGFTGNTAGLEIPFNGSFHEIEFVLLSPQSYSYRVNGTTSVFTRNPPLGSAVLKLSPVMGMNFSLGPNRGDVHNVYIDDYLLDYEVVS